MLWPYVVAIVLEVSFRSDVACIPLNSSEVQSPAPPKPEAYRLNEDVWPTHYDIEIKPYFASEPNRSAFTFEGTTTITIAAPKNGVTGIKLHHSELDILSWSLLSKNNSKPVRQVNHTHDMTTEIATFELAEPLLPNVEYLLTLNYAGLIGDSLRGFYRSYFNRSGGEQVWLGSTQFQPTHARRAFPCFDEPKFKATFQLKINHEPLQYSVYSNTPIASSADVGYNRSLTTFAVTPRMSTYLLAFIVAPFALSGQDQMQVLARPEAANQTGYGVETGLKLLRHLGEWIDYPFDAVPEMTRMYMAAVPDFGSGAMENWGLITYKEYILLSAPEDATSYQQQQTATTIAHELGHLWFGNLVTCEWWNVTWLNEGFATYVEYFGMGSLEPGWELEQQFVVERLQLALQADSRDGIHAMTDSVYSQGDAFAMFDEISYHKGAAVLRMMEHYLTTAVFTTALREYVKDRAFKTALPEDLFAALDRHNANCRSYLEPWTTQPGFPLVTVFATEEGFSLTQKRFLTNGTNHNDSTLWPVPITYAIKPEDFDNTVPMFVTTESFNVSVVNASSVRYFILNNQQVGFYRVHYEPKLWDKIGRALRSENFGGIHVLNRAQIVDDLFNLATAGVVSFEVALDILDYLKDETEYLPWLAAEDGLLALSQIIHPDDEQLFKHHILDIFSEAYELVKFQPPSSSERRVHTYLRRLVLEWTCRYGHEDCRKSAFKEFERFRHNPSVKVHPDLREVVYCEGVRQGTTEQFDFLLNLYQTTNVAKEMQIVLRALSCVTEDVLVHKFLNFVYSPSVRKQDKHKATAVLLNNPHTIASVTAYIVQHSDALMEIYGDPAEVMRMLYNILLTSNDVTVRETVRKFADSQREKWGEVAYARLVIAQTQFDSSQQYIQHHQDEIRGFLLQKDGSGAMRGTAALSVTLTLSFVLIALR